MRQFASEVMGSREAATGFHTPRSSGARPPGFDEPGYPVSPGGTVIRPPPGPPPASPRQSPIVAAGLPGTGYSGQGCGASGVGGAGGIRPSIGESCPACGVGHPGIVFPCPSGPIPQPGVAGGESNRPEEPAKYISELPKLVQADLATSAVVCGNWLAQVKQIFQGLSPSADIWFSAVEAAANQGYSRRLVADPLGRLSLDPGSVVATFDMHKFQRVESRAVTLLLASVTNQVRDDIITNRWLTTAAILYRILCVYQPKGSKQ